MGRFVVTTLLAVALATNLLMPERVVRYRPCCYDANGNLEIGHCGCGCADVTDSNSPTMSQRKTCCDPIITHFQANPNAPVLDAASNFKFDSHSDFMITQPQLAVVEQLAAHARVVFWDTGPPRGADILSFHSRLNL